MQSLGQAGLSLVSAILVALLGLPAAVAAQSSRTIRPAEALVERWFDQVPVSGGLRVGVMLPTASADLSAEFFAFLPEPAPTVLCVQIVSKDGRYEGRFRYVIEPPMSGSVRLEWVSEYLDALVDYDPNELAILAQAGEDCTDPDGPFVLTSWQGATESSDGIVLLNSDDPTSLALVRDGAVADESSCRPLGGAARAFNLLCSLPRVWLDQPDAQIVVRVLERAGRRVRPRDLPLPVVGR